MMNILSISKISLNTYKHTAFGYALHEKTSQGLVEHDTGKEPSGHPRNTKYDISKITFERM